MRVLRQGIGIGVAPFYVARDREALGDMSKGTLPKGGPYETSDEHTSNGPWAGTNLWGGWSGVCG